MPSATQRACAPVKITGGYFIAVFWTRRNARSWRCRAKERRSVVLVAGPYQNSSHDATKSDQLPRGSFGNQNPCVVKMRWYAKTIRARKRNARMCFDARKAERKTVRNR